MPNIQVDKIIAAAVRNPKRLFLADGLGAMISAITLGVVLVELEDVFGMPRFALYFLALFPCLFAIYDMYCLVKEPRNTGAFLKGIAVMNVLYCFLSIAVSIYHYQTLTIFGWLYILLEIIIVITIAGIEYRVGNALNS